MYVFNADHFCGNYKKIFKSIFNKSKVYFLVGKLCVGNNSFKGAFKLEGALKRVVANAKFTNQEIDLALVKDALKDLFVISAKMVSIENIQKTVAEYYNIKLSDLLSKRRSRSITRPRQLAMALTKELTRHSLPEIGEAFNGRDHTTVLHACKKIAELRKESPSHEEDYRNLTRALTN